MQSDAPVILAVLLCPNLRHGQYTDGLLTPTLLQGFMQEYAMLLMDIYPAVASSVSPFCSLFS